MLVICTWILTNQIYCISSKIGMRWDDDWKMRLSISIQFSRATLVVTYWTWTRYKTIICTRWRSCTIHFGAYTWKSKFKSYKMNQLLRSCKTINSFKDKPVWSVNYLRYLLSLIDGMKNSPYGIWMKMWRMQKLNLKLQGTKWISYALLIFFLY